jgi:hypothetical protein
MTHVQTKCGWCDQWATVKLTPRMTRGGVPTDADELGEPIYLCTTHFDALGPKTTTHVWNEKRGRFEPVEESAEVRKLEELSRSRSATEPASSCVDDQSSPVSS